MFPNYIDRFGRQKKATTKKQNKQRKTKKKISGNNSIYHEPLSEGWILRRS